jgi:hypothetical protein
MKTDTPNTKDNMMNSVYDYAIIMNILIFALTIVMIML